MQNISWWVGVLFIFRIDICFLYKWQTISITPWLWKAIFPFYLWRTNSQCILIIDNQKVWMYNQRITSLFRGFFSITKSSVKGLEEYMGTEKNALVLERCGRATGSHVTGSGPDRKKPWPEVTGRDRVRIATFPAFLSFNRPFYS